MSNRKTTSLKINEELWKKTKIYCINKGISISDLIEKLLRKELRK